MAVLNSKFDILRGWPDGSAVAEDFVKSNHADVANDVADGVYRHGNFVALGFGKDVSQHIAYGACGKRSDNTSAAGVRLGLIIEGDEETSSQMSNTVTCLVGGGYVVRLHAEGQFSQNAYGKASIPGGRDQFVLTRSANDNSGGSGLAAAGVANQADFNVSGGAAITMAAGSPVVVINGVACVADSDALASEFIIGTCLKVGDDFIEILVH